MGEVSVEKPSSTGLSSIFVTKDAYKKIASEFHPYHRHDLNVFLHLLTTGLGIWGAVQLAILTGYDVVVYVYMGLIFLTVPFGTGVIHTIMVAAMMFVPALQVDSIKACAVGMAAGYGLQDLAHYLTGEKTYMGSYIYTKPHILIIHTLWLLPLVIDSILMRSCFLPWFVNRNRNIVCVAASKQSVADLRTWIQKNVAETKETTHVWPHKQKETSGATKELENDAAINDAFRTVFAAKHFDVRPVQPMNEIYVTAVGAKREINSDAVFYTPHCDGPYWFLPGASLYRVLVGLTPNQMVRTRFNLQHESIDKVIDIDEVLGFDYNRELHWIDHTDKPNTERRSLLKLHYVVYPKGWHRYGNFVATLNTKYNTWARGNFLKTLRPSGLSDNILAWWIWLTTWFNAMFQLYVGWNNVVYLLCALALGPTPFLILTSYRHYLVYITTFAFRKPPVALGEFIRDVKLYKTIALLQLGRRLLPYVDLNRDVPGIVGAAAGFAITMAATARLGFIRTYFGSELGFVKPQWIEGFPYGYIPHPMIVGQLIAFSVILYWWRATLSWEDKALIGGHMGCYTVHMVQEMLTSSY